MTLAPLLLSKYESGEANRTRLKTPREFKRAELDSTGFGATLTRQVLFAVGRVAEQDEVKDGMTWLKTEVCPATGASASPPSSPSSIIWAESIPITGSGMLPARLLRGAVENDHV